MSLTRAQLLTEISTDLPDNTSGEISPAVMRGVLDDIVNNVQTLGDPSNLSGTQTFASVVITGLAGILLGNGGSPVTALAAGQLPGSATNDSAAAGKVGEYLTATNASVSLTTATAATVTSVTLSAGDWDVWGEMVFTPAGTTTIAGIQAATSPTTNVFAAAPAGGLNLLFATLTTGQVAAIPVGRERYSVAGSTVIYLVAQASFAVSTMTATGKISARRAR